MTWEAKDIKGIIEDNKDDLAFVIGNGINQRFFSDVKSWMRLLESLWNKYNANGNSKVNWSTFIDPITGQLKGITITELFDLIEMNCYYHEDTSAQSLVRYAAKKQISLKDLDPETRKGIRQIASERLTKSRDELLQEYKEQFEKLSQKSREWCNSNLEDAAGMPDYECVFKLTEVLSNNTKIQLYKGQLKKDIAEEYKLSKSSNDFNSLLETISGMNVPILTTNFDTYMSSSLNLEKRIFNSSKFTDIYPWNAYYCKIDQTLTSPTSGFGIWHINGMIDYPRSIKLGLSDYMGCVEHARKKIHSKNFNEFFDGKNQDSWEGYYTWLHIVFNKQLFIFGLALDENEVFLRWLLIQRAKYSKMYHKRLAGWFVDKGISDGKRAFLKALGFVVIDITNYDDLYHAFN